MTDPARRHQAHYLIDAITPEQLNAVVGILEVMATPLSRRLALAPPEDEIISDAENAQVAAANGPWIPFEEVLEEYGLTLEELLQSEPSQLAPQPASK